MKQMLNILAALLVMSGSMSLRAQNQDNSYLLNLHTIGSSGPAVRAVRDFLKREGDGKDEKWYKTREGFLAEFDQAGRDGKYFYDQKGNWRYSILTFGEKGLPGDIRRLVRSTYFEYSILWVKQVTGVQGFSYIVHVENGGAWKELLIHDGEMEEWKAFDK
jgi:hypothetical protein